MIVTEGVVAGILLPASALLTGSQRERHAARTRMAMIDDEPESEDPQDLAVGA